MKNDFPPQCKSLIVSISPKIEIAAAYAHEGILVSYEMARRTGDLDAAEKFAYVIDKGLSKLTSWQVGSLLENSYLKGFEEVPEQAIGGVMNSRNDPVLRIDVTQHQMHALTMAKKFIYSKK